MVAEKADGRIVAGAVALKHGRKAEAATDKKCLSSFQHFHKEKFSNKYLHYLLKLHIKPPMLVSTF